jgi:hypothetical protein
MMNFHHFYGKIILLCAGVDKMYNNFIYEQFEFLVDRLVHGVSHRVVL